MQIYAAAGIEKPVRLHIQSISRKRMVRADRPVEVHRGTRFLATGEPQAKTELRTAGRATLSGSVSETGLPARDTRISQTCPCKRAGFPFQKT